MSNRIFYLKKQNTNIEEHIKIELFKIKDFDSLKDNGTMPLKGNLHRILDYFSFDLTLRDYEEDSDMPIMISINPKGYSSSFQFSVKEVGKDISHDKLHYMEVGEPITLLKA
ncbi:hypothetical protein BD770DRAFT_439668 [Pilaira anomala]|nr:hypothetical protein BD770DRAFT_439668 [Pilaira anomala]